MYGVGSAPEHAPYIPNDKMTYMYVMCHLLVKLDEDIQKHTEGLYLVV